MKNEWIMICGNSKIRNQTHIRKKILDFYFENNSVCMIDTAFKEHMIFTHLALTNKSLLKKVEAHKKKIDWDFKILIEENYTSIINHFSNYDRIYLIGMLDIDIDFDKINKEKIISLDNHYINEILDKKIDLNYADMSKNEKIIPMALDNKNEIEKQLKSNKIKILQYREIKIANSPEKLSNAINKFSNDYESIVSNVIPDNVDIVNFHNRYIETDKKSCILYHSEPWMVHTNFQNKNKLVVAQYQSTLSEFSDCKPMRNFVDFTEEIYNYVEPLTDKIRVAFSPTKKDKLTYYHNKGYHETKEILENLKEKYPTKFDYDIIYKVSLDECIKRKKNCNIVIDECVTSSYHQSGLEGLALGRYTICSMNTKVINMLLNVSKSNYVPFDIVWINELYTQLEYIINHYTISNLIEDGKSNRAWMEQYWHPKDIIDEYINYYKELL